jgi:hypothetical protein
LAAENKSMPSIKAEPRPDRASLGSAESLQQKASKIERSCWLFR